MKSSGNRPLGAPLADEVPPVHSANSWLMTSNVWLLATLSGVRQVEEGQMEGMPTHHDCAWPGMSNSTITRTPRCRPYSTIEATSP